MSCPEANLSDASSVRSPSGTHAIPYPRLLITLHRVSSQRCFIPLLFVFPATLHRRQYTRSGHRHPRYTPAMDPPPHTRNSSLTPPDRTTVPYALQHSPSPSPVQRSASVSRPVSQQQQTTQPRRPSKTGPTQRVASASGSTCGLNYSPGDLDVGPASRSMEGFSGSFQGKEDVRKVRAPPGRDPETAFILGRLH